MVMNCARTSTSNGFGVTVADPVNWCFTNVGVDETTEAKLSVIGEPIDAPELVRH
jgi:hypothetical protein